MSNFEDYDLRRGSDLSLDDEIDLYDDYDLGSEYGDSAQGTGARRSSAAGRGTAPRRTSGGTAHRAPAHRSSGNSSSRSRLASRSSASRSTSGSRRPAGKSSRPAPSSRTAGNRRGTSKRRKKKNIKRNILVVEVVLIIVLALGLLLWHNFFGKINYDSTTMNDVEVNNLDTETEELLSNYTTLALFGVDNRSNGNLDSGNSDSIILVSINNDTKEVKMVSVQRDTYLQVAEGTYRKCNYAYNHGGVETAISMLNTNLDLKISGYVSVDFYALAAIVDDLGGLELEITQKMIDTDNPETQQNALAGYIAEVENVLKYYPNEEDYFKMSDCYFDSPGTYKLNGAQVVGYCRNRYAVNNDYGRAENQRIVIKKIIEKAKKASVSQLNDIAQDVFPSISTSLSLSQILSMASAVGDYEIAESTGFPFALKQAKISKTTGSVLVPCTLSSNVSTLHEFMYGQEDYDPTDDMVDVISDHIVSETGFNEGSADITQESDE
ncbi:MAG: LCP family protein [Pseudobutyrivibrio sp.]|nr:LCP family protein [Pseudobutyrivibrio sp.]